MQPQNVTPEERLLRLIESGQTGTRKFVFWDVRTWGALFSPYKEMVKGQARVWFAGLVSRELNIKLINRGLIVLLVLAAAGIALNMNRVQPNLKDLSSQVAASRPLAREEQALASPRPLEEYLGEAQKRDLFSLNPVAPPKPERPEPKKVEPAKPPEPVQPPKPAPLEILREKAKNLKLVGISWGEIPMAMIEDTAKRETSFLKAGQFINEIRVKAILKDRVVLSYENAEYDLF